MNILDIKPGDLVELKFICQVDEVKFTVNGGYFLRLRENEYPKQHEAFEIDMNKAGDKIRKLQFDSFLGEMK